MTDRNERGAPRVVPKELRDAMREARAYFPWQTHQPSAVGFAVATFVGLTDPFSGYRYKIYGVL